jgi:hypothetical protein
MENDGQYEYSSPMAIRKILIMYNRLVEAAYTDHDMTALAIVMDIKRAAADIMTSADSRKKRKLRVTIDHIVCGMSTDEVMRRHSIGRMTCWRYDRETCRSISNYLNGG